MDLPKVDRDTNIFTEYSVSSGMRIYDEDLTTFETVFDTTFDYNLDEPTYEFGDEYEFDERPYDDAIFTEESNFEWTDLFNEEVDGTGAQIVQGYFTAFPNF